MKRICVLAVMALASVPPLAIAATPSFRTEGPVAITCTIFNRSGDDIASAEYAVKDNESNSVRICRFGRIKHGETAKVYVHLPGWLDYTQFRVNFDGGHEPLVGVGHCKNCPSVDLTISP